VPPPRLRDGVRAAAPLALAPVLFGAAFGLLAVDAGFHPLGAVALSATAFAGSAQFAAATIVDDGGGAAAAIVAALLLNARYVPISISAAGDAGSSSRS
jgi:predicted branched-subunit amino acid permease